MMMLLTCGKLCVCVCVCVCVVCVCVCVHVLCREYLATFKKTVAMHEVFLQRLAAHPTLRSDNNYQVFLEFEGDVSLWCS